MLDEKVSTIEREKKQLEYQNNQLLSNLSSLQEEKNNIDIQKRSAEKTIGDLQSGMIIDIVISCRKEFTSTSNSKSSVNYFTSTK